MNDNQDDLTARLRRSLDARGLAPELSSDLVSGASDRTAPRLANPARRLQIAGGATLLVAAATVGALVVTSPFQQEPLFTSAGNAAAGGATTMAAEDSTSKMMAGAWINYEYVAGGGLSTDGGRGTVYQLQRVGTAQERAAEIAKAFDLDGDAVKADYFDPAYPTYVIGSTDGTAAAVNVTWAGTGNWYYNDPAANPPITCDAIPIEGDGGTGASSDTSTDAETLEAEKLDPSFNAEEICEYVEPKLEDSLAPREADAKKLAKAIFAETGLDVAASDIRVTVDPWGTTATANLEVDGVTTALDWTVVWSPTGDISWAYGHSIEAVDRGEFGTVSAASAVERLADWRWYGAAGPDFQGGMNILAMDAARSAEAGAMEAETDPAAPADPDAPVESPQPTEPAEPSEVPGEEPSVEPLPEPLPEPSIEPLPEPLPEPETVVVTVDSAEATLLLMWDSEGNAWLVPGFAVQHPDGWYNTVVSLEEGVIELPAPVEIEPYLEENLRMVD